MKKINSNSCPKHYPIFRRTQSRRSAEPYLRPSVVLPIPKNQLIFTKTFFPPRDLVLFLVAQSTASSSAPTSRLAAPHSGKPRCATAATSRVATRILQQMWRRSALESSSPAASRAVPVTRPCLLRRVRLPLSGSGAATTAVSLLTSVMGRQRQSWSLIQREKKREEFFEKKKREEWMVVDSRERTTVNLLLAIVGGAASTNQDQ